MSQGHRNTPMSEAGTMIPHGRPRIPVWAFGLSLSIFIALSYALCVGFDLLFPAHAMYRAWAPLLPGFTWISWPSFGIGLVESFAYGWYIALIFGPLFNFFSARFR